MMTAHGHIDIASGLVAYWKLDGNSQSSTHAFDGTDTSVSYSAGKLRLGADFDGSSSKITVATGAPSPFRQTGEITYAFWTKIPASGITRMGTATAGGHGSGGLFSTLTSLGFSWTPTTPNSDRTYSATISQAADTWFHVAFTMNFGGASAGQFYVNGAPVATAISTNDVADGTPRTSYNASSGDCLGARYVNSLSYGNGSLDEVGIWDRALGASEVSALYNSGAGLQHPFLTTVLQFGNNVLNY